MVHLERSTKTGVQTQALLLVLLAIQSNLRIHFFYRLVDPQLLWQCYDEFHDH